MSQDEPTTNYRSRTTICEVCGNTYLSFQKYRHEQSRHHKYYDLLQNAGVAGAEKSLNLLKRTQQLIDEAIKENEIVISNKKTELQLNSIKKEFDRCKILREKCTKQISGVHTKTDDTNKWLVDMDSCVFEPEQNK